MSVATRIETPGETAYRQIRADILFGRLLPSQKLKLDGLREHYGTSVSTLREILSRLSSATARGTCPRTIVRAGRCRVGSAGCRGLPQARPHGRADGSRRPERYGSVEKLRLAISPSAHFSMRIASLGADPRGRL